MYLQIDVDDNRTMNFSIVQPTSKVTAIEVVLLCDRSSGEKLASYVVNRTFQIFLSFQIFLAASSPQQKVAKPVKRTVPYVSPIMTVLT